MEFHLDHLTEFCLGFSIIAGSFEKFCLGCSMDRLRNFTWVPQRSFAWVAQWIAHWYLTWITCAFASTAAALLPLLLALLHWRCHLPPLVALPPSLALAPLLALPMPPLRHSREKQ
jgi:hypothetical protein